MSSRTHSHKIRQKRGINNGGELPLSLSLSLSLLLGIEFAIRAFSKLISSLGRIYRLQSSTGTTRIIIIRRRRRRRRLHAWVDDY